MRSRPAPVAALAAALALVAAAPAAGAATRVWATPSAATAGDRVVIRGSDFGRTEFCRPRATLRVLGVVIARAVIGPDNGNFATRWIVPEAIGTGVRRITVRQECESGRDGSLVVVRGTGWIYVR